MQAITGYSSVVTHRNYSIKHNLLHQAMNQIVSRLCSRVVKHVRLSNYYIFPTMKLAKLLV